MPSDNDLTSGRSAAALRADIEKTREQLASSVVQLRQEVANRTDWREWVRNRPVLAIGACVAIGFLIGSRR
jgi:ElaB/YqjD/DUF883 family membrane-anchored ribosome-binding protein